MAFTLLERLLTRHPRPDGGNAVLEQAATGIPPALLDAAAAAQVVNGPAAVPASRRDRSLDTGQRVLVDAMASKVLHAWLQNRHQTLYPLTLNLASVQPGDAAALARWMAVAGLAGSLPAHHSTAHHSMAHHSTARDWMAGIGAPADALAAYDAACADPPPLHAALAAVSRGGLSAYAYVVAVVSLDPHDPAAAPFLDYVSTRLALPTEVVRSANRRYRR